MNKLPQKLASFLAVKSEDGVTALEYGLIAALIALAIIIAVGALGTQIGATFNTIAGNMKNAG